MWFAMKYGHNEWKENQFKKKIVCFYDSSVLVERVLTQINMQKNICIEF